MIDDASRRVNVSGEMYVEELRFWDTMQGSTGDILSAEDGGGDGREGVATTTTTTSSTPVLLAADSEVVGYTRDL